MKILLDQQILRSPSVNVQVTKYRPFYIMGEVAKPGEYPYRPGMTVLTAVSTAGGYTFRADQEDRQSVGEGKSVSVRVDLGGRRIIKKKTKTTKYSTTTDKK